MGRDIELKEPFPGEYKFVKELKPKKLECAAEIIIPGKTIEPWQVHYEPFREIISITNAGGELWVQTPIWHREYGKYSLTNIFKYGLHKYTRQGPSRSVQMQVNVPHRLINAFDEDLTIIVESSPGPKHRQDLEPEFPSLTNCLDALHKELIRNTLRDHR